ncbi:MAG TPA: hypothetical protein VLB87_13730, partial [Pyrinomonadaceae bacterium]|nr:hypothetical protein [Pyrinomonadaceae bacterium]
MVHMRVKHFILTVVAIGLSGAVANAQEFTVAQSKVFAPQNKKVLLLKETTTTGGGPAQERNIILFQTNLRVNTDGSPLSYHPQDPRGRTKALNNVCNGIAVRRVGQNNNL